MSDWPAITAEAKSERDRLASSHRPVLLPAYDVEGRLISPERCQAMLSDAIVRVAFTLSHSFIGSLKKEDEIGVNMFVGDIYSVRVLVNSP